MDYDALEKLREMYAAVTPGNLATAERHIASEMITCPVCSGDGEVEAADYCNFDHKALGVQFYGIGTEFGAHEQLWSAVMANLPALLDVIAELRGDIERREMARAQTMMDLADLRARNDALREAGRDIVDNMFSTYTARNGRKVGIQADDGEKCWIVHSDHIASLEAALAANREPQKEADNG